MTKYSFANIPRIPGKPLDIRQGDNRITRDAWGSVEVAFGWYSDSQILARSLRDKNCTDKVSEYLRKNLYLAKMLDGK